MLYLPMQAAQDNSVNFEFTASSSQQQAHSSATGFTWHCPQVCTSFHSVFCSLC